LDRDGEEAADQDQLLTADAGLMRVSPIGGPAEGVDEIIFNLEGFCAL
jgi:hypothetical protein